ncbi:hypothetical protein ACWD4L_34450 [Streptomyces sp. NPDC002596]|uniref:hypothetical protein n=1 Tax=Streptomyces sp. NPDC059460 TaxID=3346840 RepID=UPI003690A356
MRNHIGRIFVFLLNLLLPAPGHHRAAGYNPAQGCMDTPAIRGEDVRLVRPYIVAHERRTRSGPVCGCFTGLGCTAHRTVATW